MNRVTVLLYAVVLLGFAATVNAADNFLGVYEGTVQKVQSLRMKQGEPCMVTVAAVDKLHTITFRIDDVEMISVDEARVYDGIKAGREVKIVNLLQGKGTEAVMFQHNDGALERVKILHRHMGVEDYVLCGALSRKQE